MTLASRPESGLVPPRTSPTRDLRREMILVQRGVQACVVLGLVWKLQFFAMADEIYQTYRLDDPFFPAWLESLTTLRFAFVAAVISGVLAILFTQRTILVIVLLIQWLSLGVLMIHQGSYNDMTFLTSWWTTLWSLWLISQLDSQANMTTVHRATRLGAAILSLILLGAAVGKWTPEYWSGTVLHEIYFRERSFWLFNLVRAQYEPAQVIEFAKWHSRMVIVIESVAGLTLWCLPPRIAGWCGFALMLLIPVTNNWLLFSVTLSLLGLSWGILRLSQTNRV